MDVNKLEQLGLSEKEAKVYLAALESGPALASILAQKSGVNRPSTYDACKSLIQKGLMSKTITNNLNYFVAEKPDQLVQNFQDKLNQSKELLPELLSISKTASFKPKIRFFEGVSGIKQIYEETLGCKEKVILQAVSIIDFIASVGEDFAKDYIKRRSHKKILAKALHAISGDLIGDPYGITSQKHLRDVRYLPPKMFSTAMIMIYDDKVVMMSTKKESFGFIIESKEFSQTMKNWFEVLWQTGSKKPHN